MTEPPSTDAQNPQDCCERVDELVQADEEKSVHLIRIESRTLPIFKNLANFAFFPKKEQDRELGRKRKIAAWLAFVFNWLISPNGVVTVSGIAALTIFIQCKQLRMYEQELDSVVKTTRTQMQQGKSWQLVEVERYRTNLTKFLNDRDKLKTIKGSRLETGTLEEIVGATKTWIPMNHLGTSGEETSWMFGSLARGQMLVELNRDGLHEQDVQLILSKGVFSYADLSSMDSLKLEGLPIVDNLKLAFSCFEGVHLKGINWPGMVADDGRWSSMKIQHCSFFGGSMQRIDLRHSSAVGVDFSGVDLRGANMIGFRADTTCNFLKADISGAIIEDALYQQIKDTVAVPDVPPVRVRTILHW